MREFQADKSLLGWVFSLLLVLIMTGSLMLLYPLALQNIVIFFVSALPICIFLIVALFFLVIFPSMKYVLTDDALILQCGPFKYIVPYNEITQIEKANLSYHPSSTGWKLPGYTLFKIYYSDRGDVYMCATRMLKNILLIKTQNGKIFGITPREEKIFIQHLKEKLK